MDLRNTYSQCMQFFQRKSVSAEVNYGIRFTSHSDAYKFIGELAAEVESRLVAIKMKGKCITLKLKVSDIFMPWK